MLPPGVKHVPLSLAPRIPLPTSWPSQVRLALVHVISLAQFSVTHARGWTANSLDARVRLTAERDRLQQEVTLLHEEIRIKDARIAQIEPRHRPHYAPSDRFAILLLRSARGWSLAQTARTFAVTAATIASWNQRLRENGDAALVQISEPVNKFPDFVRQAVQRLKSLCPSLGKVKIAEILGRAGLHLAASTVGRIVKEPPTDPAFHHEPPETSSPDKVEKQRIVTADRPNHVWHVDLTTVPIVGGFWTPWTPNAFLQSWPFSWWAVVVLDHFSRRAMGFCLFRSPPTSAAVQAFLDRTILQQGATPRYLISDKGVQFWCSGYKHWCRLRDIMPRFGAVGQHGSIAVVERFIRTLKDEGTRRILVPQRRQDLRGRLTWFLEWYNEFRPHMTLGGKTPNEVYHARPPANQQARIEPRRRWPANAPCAKPSVPVDGETGAVFHLALTHHADQDHLPIVTLRRAA